MANFLVSTTGANVTLKDLGLPLVHPTVDRDLSLEFGPEDLSDSEDLETAIQNGDLTLKIVTAQYGEYEVDPSEYYTGMAVQNQLISVDEENYITEEEFVAGYLTSLVHPSLTGLPVTSTSSITKNIYVTTGTFQKYKVNINDIAVITGGAAVGEYTVSGINDQQQITVYENIADTSGVGTLSIYNPVAASKIGVDPTNITGTIATNLQEVLEDLSQQVVASGINENTHASLHQLIHFIDEGPAEQFTSGAYKEILPMGNIFPISVIWYTDNTKTKKLVEKTIERSIGAATNIKPTPITWKVYDTDGITILATVSDAIVYSGIIEYTRIRTIT